MVQVIRPGDRDRGDTAQTSGMAREAAICSSLTDARGLWMGVGRNQPGAASGAHHHGESESGIYVLAGRIRFRWGDRLEHVIDANAGDFVFVPPHEVHVEENLSPDAEVEFVVARNTAEAIVVNVPDPRSS
jgi:uncharacterized RmlC-like cupin family protein